MRFIRKILKEGFKILFSIVVGVVDVFPDAPWANRLRGLAIGSFFKSSGRNLQICKRAHLLYPQLIVVGDDVYIGYSVWINAQAGISIGDETILGPFVAIATGNHTKLGGSYRFGAHEKKEVVIKSGCWLAAGVTVSPGVCLEKGTLLAAGAAISSNSEGDSIYGGVPARLIKKVA